MKIRVLHILIACAALFSLVGCSCSNTKIIPRGDMAEIYAEMLMADQWVIEHSKTRAQADTSLVYEPIFQKYGYSTADYRASVSHYMKDPERYSRILRTTSELLEAQLRELKELKKIQDRRKAIVPYEINPFRLYYNRSVEGLWEYGDSVSVEVDSLVPVLEMHQHQTADTVYEGLNMIIRADSLAVKDTIMHKVEDKILEKTEVKSVEKRLQSKELKEAPIVGKDAGVQKHEGLLRKLSEMSLDSLKRK